MSTHPDLTHPVALAERVLNLLADPHAQRCDLDNLLGLALEMQRQRALERYAADLLESMTTPAQVAQLTAAELHDLLQLPLRRSLLSYEELNEAQRRAAARFGPSNGRYVVDRRGEVLCLKLPPE